MYITSGPPGGDREFGNTVFLCIRLERWTKGDAASGPGSGALALLRNPKNNKRNVLQHTARDGPNAQFLRDVCSSQSRVT